MTGSAALASKRLIRAIAADQLHAEQFSKTPEARTGAPLARAHEAVRPSRSRRLFGDEGSGNRIVSSDAKSLRDQARALERDYDVAANALNILVQNTVGSGIDVMPAPRKAGGQVNRDLAQQLRDLWDEWWDRPEVTGIHDFGKCQQLMARSAFRDGEAFFQHVRGMMSSLDHLTIVPYSLEMLEADLVPLHADDASSNLSQGVYRNAWGRITGYQVYKSHPGDMIGIREETKFVPADRLQSVACINRIGQVRGLSIFAPVMNRFRDIQDYENSERIAAKVAASFCAQIIKDTSLLQTPSLGGLDAAVDRTIRSFNMVPGLIGDELLPGERIEVIDSKRPNPNIETYLNSQMRRAAGGLGTSFSSLSMNYNGTYSAQRQELVEKFGYYAMLGEWFVAKFVRPVWEEFVIAAVQRGLVRIPAGWTIRNIQAAHFVRPAMPWIDPLKEILARQQAVEAGWLAPQQAILQSGNDPEEVLRLREDWKAQAGDPPPTQPNTEGRAAFVALASGDPNA